MNWLSHENKQSCGDFPVDLEHFVTLLQCYFLDIPRLYPANYWDMMHCISESSFVETVVTSKIPVTTTEVQDEMPTVAGVELAKHGQENCSY